MKNATLRATLGLLSITASLSSLVGCGSGRHISPAQRVHQAPMRNEDTGVIVSGVSEAEIAAILETEPTLKVRVVNANHNLYEVFGADVTRLKELIPNSNATIEKNKYVQLKSFGFNEIGPKGPLQPLAPAPDKKNPLVHAIEENLHLRLEGPILEFANTCKLSTFLKPRLKVKDNQGRDRKDTSIFFELGQSLTLDASETTSVVNQQSTLSYLWIITAPEDSALPPTAYGSATVNYQADSTGMYLFAAIAKDGLGYCGLDIRPFYVTSNQAYHPVNALPDNASESIDANTFWHVFYVGSQEIWKAANGMGLTIGIIDSGVDYNHPALAANIRVNTNEIPNNGVDDDGNGFVDDYAGYDFGQDDSSPDDDYGHGTHVAGIAASNVFGAARKSLILPTKFGAGLGFDIASITGAIKYSVDQGARVINMSLGWEEDFTVMREALNYAEEHDVLVVAAAGNDTENNDLKPTYPSSYPNGNILAVAATDEHDNLTFYSNFGQRVHIAAPGGTLDRPIMSSYKHNPLKQEYKGLMGTSMASPLVAGVAAQVWSTNTHLTAKQVKQVLMDTGRVAAGLQGKVRSGRVVDAKAALAQVQSL